MRVEILFDENGDVLELQVREAGDRTINTPFFTWHARKFRSFKRLHQIVSSLLSGDEPMETRFKVKTVKEGGEPVRCMVLVQVATSGRSPFFPVQEVEVRPGEAVEVSVPRYAPLKLTAFGLDESLDGVVEITPEEG